MPVPLPRRVSKLVCAFGVVVAVVLALVPVRTDFGDDPLLRLRQLDPQLSPPGTEAECGSPILSLDSSSEGRSLYELARDNGCRRAAQRRLLIAVATGTPIVVLGLLVLAAPSKTSVSTESGLLSN